MKKFIAFLFFAFMLIISVPASFAESFYIDDYSVTTNVKQNGNYDVEEVIKLTFTESRHGIIRNIPVKYQLSYPDGSKIQRYSRVENVTVEEENAGRYTAADYELFGQDDDFLIKIGDPDVYVNGKHTYKIKYEYINQRDPHKDFDEFYYNLIGTGWAVEIKKAGFKINMPFEFDKSKLGISAGKYGTAGFKDTLEFSTDGKIVTGVTKVPLMPHEGITARITLPEKYFTYPGTDEDERFFILFCLAILTAFSFGFWAFLGKDKPVIPVVAFRPPENKNSAEFGAEYKGDADNSELVSLLIYLASKGYLKIENNPPSFVFTKLKNYDGTNTIEKKFLEALFKTGNVIKRTDLKYSSSFYRKCGDLVNEIRDEAKNKIYNPKSTSFFRVMTIFFVTILIYICSVYALTGYSSQALGYILGSENVIFNGIILTGILIFAVYFEAKKTFSQKLSLCLFTILVSGGTFAVLFAVNRYMFLEPDYKTALTGAFAFIVSLVCLANLRKHSDYGTKSLGEIEGFKQFIDFAQKDKIEELSKEDPEYCYKMLPFAYVLGISSKWMQKFEGIIEPPDWYSGATDAASFSRLMSSFSDMASPSEANGGISHSSGSSSGGGGFSGGGGGGGGGSSW